MTSRQVPTYWQRLETCLNNIATRHAHAWIQDSPAEPPPGHTNNPDPTQKAITDPNPRAVPFCERYVRARVRTVTSYYIEYFVIVPGAKRAFTNAYRTLHTPCDRVPRRLVYNTTYPTTETRCPVPYRTSTTPTRDTWRVTQNSYDGSQSVFYLKQFKWKWQK